jgi:NTP pyrophosphatase (non-canonical NTP hydrolase)
MEEEPMKISEMQAVAWQNSEDKGFHQGEENLNVPSKLMLIVSELSEALEAYRSKEPYALWFDEAHDNKPEGIGAELADALIRIGDLAGILKFDLEAAVIEKMRYNTRRPFMHGGKRI